MRGIRIISNRILELYYSRRLPNAAHQLCFCLTVNTADIRLVGAFIIISIRGPRRNKGSQGAPWQEAFVVQNACLASVNNPFWHYISVLRT